MKKRSAFDDYLHTYSVGEKWKLCAVPDQNFSQVVVIPAYAEKDLLFRTLASLAVNVPDALENSFILCVVNHKEDSPASVMENNKITMAYLNALIRRKSLKTFQLTKDVTALLQCISDSKMKLEYIDAASRGYEIPRNTGGVGMARKIGMDMALRLLEKNAPQNGAIVSLDADTLVEPNYLSVVRDYFRKNVKTAIMAYAHQMPENPAEQAAICCYEIFLRYWVLGLRYAKSPWAFHSIGSTMAVAPQSYLAVRGMNKRAAGEDFYFLNKLAKVGRIDYIRETCVHPSARVSTRVPFGTGKRIERFLAGDAAKEYYLYDPQIFSILSGWLSLVHRMIDRDVDDILMEAKRIHPALKAFLEEARFPLRWSAIRRNTKDQETLLNHFHVWFDGFRTLKMINYFSRVAYPPVDMFSALKRIFNLLYLPALSPEVAEDIPSLGEQMEILRFLRTIT